METEKVLVFHVSDFGALKEGTLKVLQGESFIWELPRFPVADFPGEPASHLERAEAVWASVFPENKLVHVEMAANNGHLVVVRALVRSPITKFERGVAGIRHWMFSAEEEVQTSP